MPHPSFDASVKILEHVLVGVMVDREAHCFPPATILSGGGAIWELVSPFLVTLEPASCPSGTVWVSYGDLWTCFSVAVSRPMETCGLVFL